MAKQKQRHGEATFGDVLVSLSELPSSQDSAADGPLTITFRTLELGAKQQDGRKITVTPKLLEEIVKSFTFRQGRGYKTPIVLGHPGIGEETPAKAWEKRIEAEAKGWVDGVEAKDDGLYVTATLTDTDFAGKVRRKGYQFNSPSFTTKWVDEFGEDHGGALIDVGILNYPLQEGCGTLMSASAFAFAMMGAAMDPDLKKLLDDILTRLTKLEGGGVAAHPQAPGAPPMPGAPPHMAPPGAPPAAPGAPPMPPHNPHAMSADVEALTARVTEIENAAKAAPAKETEMTDESKAKIEAAEKEVENLTAKLNDDLSKLREQVDASTKATKDATDKAHAAECLAFLSAQIDSGKLAPARIPKEWKEKPAEAFDALGFNSLASARANFDAMPKNSVVNLAAAKSREGATGAGDITDALWNASSRRPELIQRFDGDESKARAYYLSTLPPKREADSDDDAA